LCSSSGPNNNVPNVSSDDELKYKSGLKMLHYPRKELRSDEYEYCCNG
jgi:hypothetical protein